jgi:hypothetical protein
MECELKITNHGRSSNNKSKQYPDTIEYYSLHIFAAVGEHLDALHKMPVLRGKCMSDQSHLA